MLKHLKEYLDKMLKHLKESLDLDLLTSDLVVPLKVSLQ